MKKTKMTAKLLKTRLTENMTMRRMRVVVDQEHSADNRQILHSEVVVENIFKTKFCTLLDSC